MAVQDLKIFPHILNLYLWVMINPHVGNSELYLLHWAAGFEQEKSEAEQDESCSIRHPSQLMPQPPNTLQPPQPISSTLLYQKTFLSVLLLQIDYFEKSWLFRNNVWSVVKLLFGFSQLPLKVKH